MSVLKHSNEYFKTSSAKYQASRGKIVLDSTLKEKAPKLIFYKEDRFKDTTGFQDKIGSLGFTSCSKWGCLCSLVVQFLFTLA